jgi:hypothetical protein
MVYELNRFWLKDGLPKNTASFFMSACLRDLDNIILVSYADSGMNHTGYIYQASNWIYTGKTKQRTDKYVPSGKHSRHYNNEYDYLRKVRTSKYRYVFFAIHNKRLKTQLKTQLNYTIEPYQKQENRKYKIGDTKKEQILNTITGNVFFE